MLSYFMYCTVNGQILANGYSFVALSLLVSQLYQNSPLGFLDRGLVPGIYTGKAYSGLAPLSNTHNHRLACFSEAESPKIVSRLVKVT